MKFLVCMINHKTIQVHLLPLAFSLCCTLNIILWQQADIAQYRSVPW